MSYLLQTKSSYLKLGRETAEFSSQGVQLIKNGEREQGQYLSTRLYTDFKNSSTICLNTSGSVKKHQ
jgi:hypothetical protein